MWWMMVVASLALAGKQPSKRPTDAERGEELYERHCLACHGAGARGDGPATAALREDVPAVRDFEITSELLDVVVGGRNLMPAFGDTFDRVDARRVLKHMAKLPDVETKPAAEAAEAAEPP